MLAKGLMWGKWMIRLVLVGVVFLAGIYAWVEWSVANRIYQDVQTVPAEEVALVLGTTPYVASGQQNLFFDARIDAAAELYHTGKVRHLLLSGDNRHHTYNEPKAMQKALLEKGVPATAMTLDYAGFRTLDSIVRTRSVFGLSRVMVITQNFHNRRALFIARQKDIEAIGFNASDVSLNYGRQIYMREFLARVKAVLDIFVLRTKPHFDGPPEPIQLD